jgi:hypothetical protein
MENYKLVRLFGICQMYIDDRVTYWKYMLIKHIHFELKYYSKAHLGSQTKTNFGKIVHLLKI